MPWEKAQLVELRTEASPRYGYGNLTANGRGRVGFAGGRFVYVAPAEVKRFSAIDDSIAKARNKISCAHFWSINFSEEPLLFVAVESVPPSIEIFREDKAAGTFKRVKSFALDSVYEDTSITALGSVAAADGVMLAVGLSTGVILLLAIEHDSFRTLNLLGDLHAAICSLSGDAARHYAYLAACDDAGEVKVWREVSARKFDTVYSASLGANFASAVGIRNNILFVGQFSGRLSVHDLEERLLLTDLNSNTRCITSITCHPAEDVVVVAGEDCRASILGLPEAGESELKLIFSVCVNGVITGAGFTLREPDSLDISLSVLERNYIVQYQMSK